MSDDNFVGYVVFGIIIGIIATFMFLGAIDMHYRDGQIDAMTGKIRYRLVINPDSTRGWESMGNFGTSRKEK